MQRALFNFEFGYFRHNIYHPAISGDWFVYIPIFDNKIFHWADAFARRIIGLKGDKEKYVCAAGITPSGTIHIGNFREIITVELIVRALRSAGKNVRFIYSWDDYDVFRKVPVNMPDQDL